jgi:hypothetical protein
LQKITEQGRFSSMADTVRESLQISRALQTQAQQGFTEVIVRNPETDEERVLVIPTLQSGSGLRGPVYDAHGGPQSSS